MEMYERIRDLRKIHLDMTQELFAASINISRSNLSNIEAGRIGITDRIISDICKTFNVNENWLRTGEGNIFLPKNTEDKIIEVFARLLQQDDNSFARQLVAALAELTPNQWKAVENFARTVVYGSESQANKNPENKKEEE